MLAAAPHPSPAATPPQGLSSADAAARRARGQGNNVRLHTSRSYLQILRQNAFTFINVLLFVVCAILIWMGRLDDAVLTAGLVFMNVVVGVAQEGRAKWRLDHIALLTRSKVTVMRDGREQVVDPGEVVVGDLLLARPGDQIVVDGRVCGNGRMDVDESLLTGEADHVPKRAGDAVYSGSFCVTGSALYDAEKVGVASMANTITAEARAFRTIRTPLQRDIDIIVRVLVLLASLIGLLLGLSFLLRPIPAVEQVQIAAVLVSLVPQGLFALITITYALGMVRMAGKGALAQQANAVESLSHVDMLCLDKTGTLTSNRLTFEAAQPIGITASKLSRLLGDFVASASTGNRTTTAIGAACNGQAHPILEEIPFSSAYKWSALAGDSDALRGTYVLGAPEVLEPCLQGDADLGAQSEAWAAQGLRVVLFAYRPDVMPLHDAQGQPQLPSGLIPLGMVSLRDELRPDVQDTLASFTRAGVRLKIISGDHPRTVAALAMQAGLGPDPRTISGLDLATMSEAQLAQTAEEVTIFGRITPDQKQRLARALGARGHYVAMVGDGVNDVPALKAAHLGVALESGSQATRSVADLVLLGDAFGALPVALREGQRIVNGMHDVMRLLLTRTVYETLLIVGAAIVGVAFPVTPKHNSILGLLTVGLPPLALAIWAGSGAPPRRLMHSVIHFVLPAACTIALVALPIYLAYVLMSHQVLVARSALTTTTVLCGIVLILFVRPPGQAWAGGVPVSGDRRPVALVLAMLALYGVTMFVPYVHAFFRLTPLPPLDLAAIVAAVAVWAIVLRVAWRAELFERFLGLEIDDPLPAAPVAPS